MQSSTYVRYFLLGIDNNLHGSWLASHLRLVLSSPAEVRNGTRAPLGSTPLSSRISHLWIRSVYFLVRKQISAKQKQVVGNKWAQVAPETKGQFNDHFPHDERH